MATDADKGHASHNLRFCGLKEKAKSKNKIKTKGNGQLQKKSKHNI